MSELAGAFAHLVQEPQSSSLALFPLPSFARSLSFKFFLGAGVRRLDPQMVILFSFSPLSPQDRGRVAVDDFPLRVTAGMFLGFCRSPPFPPLSFFLTPGVHVASNSLSPFDPRTTVRPLCLTPPRPPPLVPRPSLLGEMGRL